MVRFIAGRQAFLVNLVIFCGKYAAESLANVIGHFAGLSKNPFATTQLLDFQINLNQRFLLPAIEISILYCTLRPIESGKAVHLDRIFPFSKLKTTARARVNE